jgi:cell filamentation protein
MAFDPFGDHATRGYLRNAAGELDPERVKRLEHRSFSANFLTALENLQGVRQLRHEDVLDTHRTLFGAVYPWAGRDRAQLAPDLAIGKAGHYDMFAHPGDVRRAVEYGLEMGRDPASMRSRPGEVFGTLARPARAPARASDPAAAKRISLPPRTAVVGADRPCWPAVPPNQ